MSTGDLTTGDPEYWIARGRSDAHARLLAQTWRDYPDLPNDAPVDARVGRSRERALALKPIQEQISAETERERRTKNFAFVEAQCAAGRARDIDALILVGRDTHGYDWDEAVAYADARYAAEAGWDRRGPSQPLRGEIRATIVAAYDRGFRDGGADPDDLFDTARRAIRAADRAEAKLVELPSTQARPLPSTWPQPTDAPRPAAWAKRLLIIDPSHVDDGIADMVTAAEGADAAHIILLSGLGPDDTRSALAEAVNREDIQDILIAVSDEWLDEIDAHMSMLPLARTMERLRNSRLQRRAQMKLWIARGRTPGSTAAAGHIRWGKAIAGLSGRLGDFSAHYDGPAAPRGHRIVVRGPHGTPATGFFDAAGKALNPEAVISNRSRLRDEMARILRSFAASTRLGPAGRDPMP